MTAGRRTNLTPMEVVWCLFMLAGSILPVSRFLRPLTWAGEQAWAALGLALWALPIVSVTVRAIAARMRLASQQPTTAPTDQEVHRAFAMFAGAAVLSAACYLPLLWWVDHIRNQWLALAIAICSLAIPVLGVFAGAKAWDFLSRDARH